MNARCVIVFVLINMNSGFNFNAFYELVLYFKVSALLLIIMVYFMQICSTYVDILSWVLGNFVTSVSHQEYNYVLLFVMTVITILIL